MKITILGSGTSTGVPVIGCACHVCKSKDPKENRTRASILVETNDHKKIVIDTGPDFRMQMLRENISQIDAVIYTHLHADHCHGFDDIRVFTFADRKKTIPVYLAQDFASELKERMHYAFADTGYPGYKPQPELKIIPDDGLFTIGATEFETFRVKHGPVQTSVFRIGNFAYATDFKFFTPDRINQWRNKIDVMIASGIHFKVHETHSNIPETVALFEKLGVKQGILTHLSHSVDYRRDKDLIPKYVDFGYDGMQIDV